MCVYTVYEVPNCSALQTSTANLEIFFFFIRKISYIFFPPQHGALVNIIINLYRMLWIRNSVKLLFCNARSGILPAVS